MNRFLCLLVLCLSSLAMEIQAQETRASRTRPSTAVDPRIEMPLRSGWRFKLGPESATDLKAEPDATWTTVSVPHTWNRVGYLNKLSTLPLPTASAVEIQRGPA